ncbi:TrbG/VirB9 family P-type conjugative transfer protein [Fusobacterium sp. SYSU M8D902]|uniref:TrbG/VirB9 family P-type conjugative transfer protein n=1 Tax=Fusobacterium sp. SYSU M8D902 TaxID=3159562 RepID=UPI0032E3BAF9
MIKKTIICLMLSLNVLSIASQKNIVTLKDEARKSQYEKVVYKDNKIYEVYGKPLQGTALVFSKNEIVKNLTLSDPLNWSGLINENKIYLKPIEETSPSTLFVTTNKRDYYFNLKIESGLYNPVIEFLYPEEQKMFIQNYLANQKEEEAKRIKLNISDIKNINNNYSWKKRYDWTPTNIIDDGTKTYIFLSVENKDMPTIYEKIGKNEYQILIPVISQNQYGQKVMEINKVFKEAYLQLHREKIVIRNKNR